MPGDVHHHASEHILHPVKSAQLWDSSATPCSDANGRMAGVGVHKGGVDEDSLLALLLEDSPTTVETYSSAFVSNKQNTYTSSVSLSLIANPLTR